MTAALFLGWVDRVYRHAEADESEVIEYFGR